MATSPRKHVVPAGGETPRRQALNDLAASVNDIAAVANTTERAQLLAALGWVPSPTRPLVVSRADAPTRALLEYTINGTDWTTLAGEQQLNVPTGSLSSGWAATDTAAHQPRLRLTGNRVSIHGSVTRQASGTGAGASLLSVPAIALPPSPGTRFIGVTLTSAGNASMLYLANGVLGMVYGNTAPAVGVAVPLVGEWWLD